MTTDYELGPKMRALTERQRAFVVELVLDPMLSHAEAARRAGYSDSSEAAKVTGHRLAHDQRIIDAMHEQAGRRLRALSMKALHRVEQMMDDEDGKTVLKAALGVLDRVGFGAQQNININQTVTDQSGKAIMDRIRALADKLGVDKGKLLGAPVVDAEFTEVKDD